jgi:hypothetical protein
MIPIIQKQLDIFKDTVWNSHRIRAQKDTRLPDGVPNHIYAFPEEYGLEECGMCKHKDLTWLKPQCEIVTHSRYCIIFNQDPTFQFHYTLEYEIEQ